MSEPPGSPGPFMTEVPEATQNRTPVQTPRKESHADPTPAIVAVLSAELAACRGFFAERLESSIAQQRVAEDCAFKALQQSRKKDRVAHELTEELERRRLSQRELNFRGHLALLATADRASLVNRALRHASRSKDERIAALKDELAKMTKAAEKERHDFAVRESLSHKRIAALEETHHAGQRLIEELRAELARQRQQQQQMERSESSSTVSGTSTTTETTASSVEGQSDATTPVVRPDDAPASRPQQQSLSNQQWSALQEANRGLAKRIEEVRSEHNKLSDCLVSERQRADAAIAALRHIEAEMVIIRRGRETDHAATSPLRFQDERSATETDTNSDDDECVRVPRDLLELLQPVGGIGGCLSTLSQRTLLIAELDDENKRLRDEIVLLEARCVTTETRLHHSVEEGVATTILLERGMGRLKPGMLGEADGSETRKTLTQAAMTLRRALEREGYDMADLPLAPDPALDLPYLRQILSDHADLCANHFHRGAKGHVIPSATRVPMIYSK